MTDRLGFDKVLHILRNPHGFKEAELRRARLEAADRLEGLQDAYLNMRAAEIHRLRAALQQIVDMDPMVRRADDLGRAARLAHDALAAGVTACLPRSDSEEAADGIEAVMAERNYPCAPKNAARVGWEAAFRWLRSHGVAIPLKGKNDAS